MEVNERNTIFRLRQEIERLESQREVSATVTATLRIQRRALRGELDAATEANEITLRERNDADLRLATLHEGHRARQIDVELALVDATEERDVLVTVNASLWEANKALTAKVYAIEQVLDGKTFVNAVLDGEHNAPE